LLKHKYWIPGITAVAVVFGVIASFALPGSYKATVSAFISAPQSVALSLAGPAESRMTEPSYAVYPALALSDDVISSLVQTFGAELTDDEDPVAAARKLLDVAVDEEAGTIELIAEHRSPTVASRVANAWAALFLEKTDGLYAESLAFFEAQFAQAGTALSEAEEVLSDFQTENRVPILSSKLQSERRALEDYWRASRSLWLSIQDAKSLQEQLRSGSAATDVSLSSQLASLLVQVNALNSYDLEPGVQIQVPEGANLVGSQTVEETVAFLASLIQALESKQRAVEQQAESVEPEILRLQKEIVDLESTEGRMVREKELALEAFVVLSRKAAETKLMATGAEGHVSLVRGAREGSVTGPRKLYFVVVAGIVGLGGSILGVLAAEYWRQGKEQSEVKE
jgi:capsular polysaccharide biosynthesis protein